MMAVSRLLLDNIANIKAYWIMMGRRSPRSRCTSARTTCRARSCASRSSTPPARGRDRAEDPGARALRPRGGTHPGAARHAVQRGASMVRLGRISYVNMAPVFYRLDAEVEEIQGVPTSSTAACSQGTRRRAHLVHRVCADNGDRLRPPPRLCVSSEVRWTPSSSSRACPSSRRGLMQPRRSRRPRSRRPRCHLVKR